MRTHQWLSVVGAVALGVGLAGTAIAQNGGWTINSPGQLPTYINPAPNGGYTIDTPGQLPTSVNPLPNGGYSIDNPGQLPTYINPLPGNSGSNEAAPDGDDN